MTERKVKLDRANKSILLRALGDVYYGQRARGGSAEETGRLILRVNDLPAGGKLTLSAAGYRLAKNPPPPSGEVTSSVDEPFIAFRIRSATVAKSSRGKLFPTFSPSIRISSPSI